MQSNGILQYLCDIVSLDVTPECYMQIPYEVKSISLPENEQKQVPLHPIA